MIEPLTPLQKAAEAVFENWAKKNGAPYRNVQITVLENDEFFAKILVTGEFCADSRTPWEERTAGMECRQVGQEWQCNGILVFG